MLFHITTGDELRAAQYVGTYRPSRFATDGFVHCSYAHQVTGVANRLFRHAAGLVLLEIDPARLASAVVDENLEGGSELFPHIYGPVPMTAIVQVHPFSCGDDGQFTFPAG
jgi:uncharacterized protein (DUF952 family)